GPRTGCRVGRRGRERAVLTSGMLGARPAVFLDRDGTIIRDEGYLSDPDRVVAIPDAAAAIARLRAAGYLIVVITNQSGLARGPFTPQQKEVMHLQTDGIFG